MAIDRRTPVSDLPQFITIEQLAVYLDVGKGLAYELARSDPRLRAVRFGRLLRIPREALAVFVR
jgi:excisionase family DNA binding protein